MFATLRALTDSRMKTLREEAEGLARRIAAEHGLRISMACADAFAACDNAPEAVARLAAALEAEGVPFGEAGQPMLASEDFGVFGRVAPTALMLLGAGDVAGLHNPDYDFPDALIATGARVFLRLVGDTLGRAAP